MNTTAIEFESASAAFDKKVESFVKVVDHWMVLDLLPIVFPPRIYVRARCMCGECQDIYG